MEMRQRTSETTSESSRQFDEILQELEHRKLFRALHGRLIKQKIPVVGSTDTNERLTDHVNLRELVSCILEGPDSKANEDEFNDALDQSLYSNRLDSA